MSRYDSSKQCRLPYWMVIHHDEEQQEYMMNTQKAVVKILAHLTRCKCPNDDQTCDHRPARKSNWCQEHQAEDILWDSEND